MVGAHKIVDVTVECQVHMGGCVGFFRKDGCRYLQNTIGMQRAPPRVPGMVNLGAHYQCPEAWEAFRRMGAQWRLQYCRHKCRRLQYCLRQSGCAVLFP